MAIKEDKGINLGQGTGRRKTATARVYLREGSGKITVNGRDVEDYFKDSLCVFIVRQPLDVTDSLKKFDVVITVSGGGSSGQAGACRHGIARALVDYDESNKPVLHENGFMTRDPRMVERKKYGQRGARRRFQFSKR
jgi:small subunit ribosomal protein S9